MLKPRSCQFFLAEIGSFAALNQIDHNRSLNPFTDLLQIFNGPRCIYDYKISASLCILVDPVDSIINTGHCSGIGAGKNQHFISCSCRHFNLAAVFNRWNDFLPIHVAAFLWRSLILQLKCGTTAQLKFLHRPSDIQALPYPLSASAITGMLTQEEMRFAHLPFPSM